MRPPPAAVIIHRLAANEYREIRQWYRERSGTAADRVKKNIFAAIERIADNPQSGPDWRGIARFYKVRRYPYVIYYEIIDPNLVLVLAIAHERRRQGYWLRRIARP